MCTDGDCGDLYLLFFIVVIGLVALVAVIWTLWAMALSAALERRGWPRAKRRATAAAFSTGVGLLLLAVALGATDVSPIPTAALVLGAAPVAIWQRRLTKRHRSRCAVLDGTGSGS
jgi:hypothetical protein